MDSPVPFTSPTDDPSDAASAGGNFTLTKVGTGKLTLGGSSDDAFLSVVASGGTVVLAKSSPSAHVVGGGLTVNSGATVQLGGTGGDQIFNSASGGVTVNGGGVFDLNGLSETIPTLTLNGNGGGTGALINSAAGTPTLTGGRPGDRPARDPRLAWRVGRTGTVISV